MHILETDARFRCRKREHPFVLFMDETRHVSTTTVTSGGNRDSFPGSRLERSYCTSLCMPLIVKFKLHRV